MQRGAACAGALLYFLSSQSAHAQSAAPFEARAIAPGYADRLFHVEAMTGIATAVGLLGVRGEINLGNPISLGLGVGANAHGPLWEAHARWRIIHGVNHRTKTFHALTFEGSFSRARYAGIDASFDAGLGEGCDKLNPNDGCYAPPITPQLVSWGQGELGWEAVFPSGFTLRLASGIAHQIGSYQWQCTVLGAAASCGTQQLPSESLFVFSVGLGYAF